MLNSVDIISHSKDNYASQARSYVRQNPNSKWFSLVKGLPDALIKDGYVQVPDAPGLGIEDINDNTVKKYLHKERCGFFEDTVEWNGEWANDREWS